MKNSLWRSYNYSPLDPIPYVCVGVGARAKCAYK